MNDETQARRGRRQVTLLALVFFGPLIIAGIMYFTGFGRAAPDAGVNYGILLDPPVTLDAKLHFDSGLRGRWALVLLPGAICDDSCRKALIDMRQIRLATGREIDRIERAVIAERAPAGLDALLAEHPGLVVITGTSDIGRAINAALAGLNREHIYLLDPIGNVILRYPLNPDRKGMLGDLKKLLKLSRIG